ncbi:MAG: GNAT family protein [bacterium]
METYPKLFELKDGTEVEFRIMTEDDLPALIQFFQSLPEEDRLYLRSDTSVPENVRRRYGELDYDRLFPLLAWVGDRLIGMATIWRAPFGWTRNLGEVRIVVGRDFQRKGLATIFSREIFFQALKQRLYKLQAELMDSQESAIAAFEKLGFHREATLKKHVTDVKGYRRDLVIMSFDVEDMWCVIEDHVKTPEFRMH